jgi:hypothetical protein
MEVAMASPIDDARLRAAALAYVVALREGLTAQNAAPQLGAQKQAVQFILAAPALRRQLSAWAVRMPIYEGHASWLPQLPQDELYRSVRRFLELIEETAG